MFIYYVKIIIVDDKYYYYCTHHTGCFEEDTVTAVAAAFHVQCSWSTFHNFIIIIYYIYTEGTKVIFKRQHTRARVL